MKQTGRHITLSGFSDQGRFSLQLNEERIGVIEFDWQSDGTYRGSSSITLANQHLFATIQIKSDAEGRWYKVQVDSPLGRTTLTRRRSTAVRVSQREKHKFEIHSDAAIYDSYSPALLSAMTRNYDKDRKGEQTFRVFVVPGVSANMVIRLIDYGARSVRDQAVHFDQYSCLLLGVEMRVFTTADNKICLVEVPSYNSAFVREGYELLRDEYRIDSELSQPTYAVHVDRGVRIPMRDGIDLAADIYRPGTESRQPVILVRTPYGKEIEELQSLFYARRGYAVAVQDVRGRFSSAGVWEPFVNEGHDGYDTIEWLAQQPWSTGKVGMIGGSYLGYVQWRALAERPPHLVTIVPIVSPPDPFYNVPYERGVFLLSWAIWWLDVMINNATLDLSGAAMLRVLNKKLGTHFFSLPVIDLDKLAFGQENPHWRSWIQHPSNDSYWQAASFLERLRDANIPVFHHTGWFDGNGIGTKLNYLRMMDHGHAHQKLIIGPWGHTHETREFDGRDFGTEALLDMQRAYLQWFDYWLKGIDNGVGEEPLVSIFVMGANRWLKGDVYPFPQTLFEKWFLASNGQANSTEGGKLVRDPADSQASADRFIYDPGDPTPDTQLLPSTITQTKSASGTGDDVVADPSLLSKSFKVLKKLVRSVANEIGLVNDVDSHDHEYIARVRKDILVYTSDPFQEPYTFAGPISAVLYASSSAPDTDWHMRLINFDADGHIFVLAHGTIRARFRNSTVKPEFLVPHQVYEYVLDLWQTGVTITKGSRLRIEVASAAFPTYSRNLNTGEHNEVATRIVRAEQTVFHNEQFPSHVILPVIPEMS